MCSSWNFGSCLKMNSLEVSVAFFLKPQKAFVLLRRLKFLKAAHNSLATHNKAVSYSPLLHTDQWLDDHMSSQMSFSNKKVKASFRGIWWLYFETSTLSTLIIGYGAVMEGGLSGLFPLSSSFQRRPTWRVSISGLRTYSWLSYTSLFNSFYGRIKHNEITFPRMKEASSDSSFSHFQSLNIAYRAVTVSALSAVLPC